MKRTRMPGIAALLACAALAAAVAEGALRLARGTPPADPVAHNFEYSYLEPRVPFFERWERGPVDVYRARRPGAAAVEFKLPKPRQAVRVFIVGGSVAMPFSRMASAAMEPARRAFPGRAVELLGCGMPGYDSERDLRTVREVLRYAPDLIVVLAGNNEAAFADLRWPRLYPLNRALRRFWLWRLPQELLASGAGRPRPGRFERNLRAMARQARAAGVPLVLCALPANLRDTAPAFTGPPDDAAFDAGWDAWTAGDIERAAESWRLAARRLPADPHALFRLAKALDRLGRVEEARGLYARAADLGPPGSSRCSPACNELIRRVAREEGAIVADLEKLFARLSPDGIIGASLMLDQCHWRQEHYPLALVEILKAAHDSGAIPGPWDWSWLAAARPGLERPLIARERQDHYARGALAWGLSVGASGPPEPLSEVSLAQLETVRARHPETWRAVASSPHSLGSQISEFGAGQAPALGPDLSRSLPRFWLLLGETARRAGDRALAVRLFDRALALEPGLEPARRLRARALRQ